MSRIEAKQSNGSRAATCTQYPSPNRSSCVRVGTILFVSGHPSTFGMNIREPGRLGAGMTIEEGYAAAPVAALLMLATVKEAVTDAP